MNSSKISPSRNCMALAVLSALVGSPAWASTINVTNLLDVAAVADGSCTLREAVANANSDSDTTGGDCPAGTGADIITFGVNGTTVLSSTLTISDADGLTLDSLGRSVTISGGNAVRVLWVTPGAGLTLKNLTVANGYADPQGGGVYNQFGSLTVLNSTFVGNTATRTGGGIANYSDTTLANPGGNLTVVNSTFSGNRSVFGGAIRNSGISANITNSTIVGNSVQLPVCPPGFFCSLEDNGGGIENLGTLNLHNSIVAGNTAAVGDADIGGSPTTASYNLIGFPANLFYRWNGVDPIVPVHGSNGNITGVDASTLVETTLANHGGPTQTLALIPGSGAIDAADKLLCATAPVNNVDQRGLARPQGPQCDIGAFELASAPAADLAVSGTVSAAMVRDSLTWTIVVKNNGTADATGVTLIDTLPASGLSSISATTSQGSCSAPSSGKITCRLGGLANTASATVTVKAIPTAALTLSNQVTVLADQTDGQPLNNSAVQTVAVQPLLCNGLVPTIVGTPGADTLFGTKRRDVIHGLSGNDTISGGADNDVICGGLGQDTLKGDAGNDTLNGEAGTDSCDGGAGTDTAANCEAKTGIP
ncbi:choice-of-anchor Q domain-containing protein [Methylomonas sp. TEB]|uniref:choice-of-anchor Q domain-containing protein n=1 Tax=Methylomonas sp. TEB TaxID=3398229 RepID=UPI0039F493E4